MPIVWPDGWDVREEADPRVVSARLAREIHRAYLAIRFADPVVIVYAGDEVGIWAARREHYLEDFPSMTERLAAHPPSAFGFWLIVETRRCCGAAWITTEEPS